MEDEQDDYNDDEYEDDDEDKNYTASWSELDKGKKSVLDFRVTCLKAKLYNQEFSVLESPDVLSS